MESPKEESLNTVSRKEKSRSEENSFFDRFLKVVRLSSDEKSGKGIDPFDSRKGRVKAMRDVSFNFSGKTIGPYRVHEKLGGGGMGVVYKAKDSRLRRTVALKFLPPRLCHDEQAKQRFIAEAMAASALDHPNICTIHEIGETEDDQLFIVMAYYKGKTLKHHVMDGPLAIEEALDIATQIARGLEQAHASGIVHRDIKPANVMLARQMHADAGPIIKILDFGLAKMSDVHLTQSGSTLGTVAYMSPEQTRGEEVDHRTDIWALGVVFYEMLAGQRPFKGDYEQAIIYSVLNEDPASLTQVGSTLPPDLEHVVMMCLEKDPELRYPDVSDLLSDLEAWRHGATQHESATSRTPKGRRSRNKRPVWHWQKGGVVLTIVLLVTVGAIASLGLLQRWIAPTKIESMAVLPCSHKQGEADIDYLCDVFSESLIASLSQIPGLMVKSFQIVESYKHSPMNVLEVGRELDVEAVMTAEVDEQPEALYFAVEITDVESGAHIWGKRFESPATGVRGFHEAIALDVTEDLQLVLSEREKRRFRVNNTYMQARYYWERRTAESLERAITLFEEVIREDSQFASAYAGLAISYVLLPYYSGYSPAESYPKARAAAEQALRLDESLEDAYASLGLVMRDYERDWMGAEREFMRAIELDPGYWLALQWYAEYLAMVGRFEEAEAQIRKAEQAKPLSLTTRAVHGWILLCAGRIEEARLQLEATLDMDRDFPVTHWFLGQLYVQEGQFNAAIETLQEAVRLSGGASRMVADLGSAYALYGDTTNALVQLDLLRSIEKQGSSVSRYEYAVVYAGLGDNDQAIEELEAALEDRTWQVVNMNIDPMLYPLRGDPRFPDLVRSMGLPGP